MICVRYYITEAGELLIGVLRTFVLSESGESAVSAGMDSQSFAGGAAVHVLQLPAPSRPHMCTV